MTGPGSFWFKIALAWILIMITWVLIIWGDL